MSHQALPTAQCSDGALICIDLAHIIEVECVIFFCLLLPGGSQHDPEPPAVFSFYQADYQVLNGQKCVTGCTAVAAAQILCANKYEYGLGS